MATKTAMTNAVARRFFLHDADQYHGDTYSVDSPYCCYFSDGNWGFWVRPCGSLDIDETSANGKLPERRIVDACVRSAVRYLKHRNG